jgi:hypothetical protein
VATAFYAEIRVSVVLMGYRVGNGGGQQNSLLETFGGLLTPVGLSHSRTEQVSDEAHLFLGSRDDPTVTQDYSNTAIDVMLSTGMRAGSGAIPGLVKSRRFSFGENPLFPAPKVQLGLGSSGCRSRISTRGRNTHARETVITPGARGQRGVNTAISAHNQQANREKSTAHAQRGDVGAGIWMN